MIKAITNDSDFAFLKTAMDVSSKAHQVVSSNIANIDTPGYRAREIQFKEFMRDYDNHAEHEKAARLAAARAEESGSMGDQLGLPPMLNYQDYEVEEVSNFLVERIDGNNVDIDREMGKLAANRGSFDLASNFMRRKFLMMTEVLNSK